MGVMGSWVGAIFYGKCNYQPILSKCTLSRLPENIGKPKGFLMFSEGKERVHGLSNNHLYIRHCDTGELLKLL